MEKDRKTVREEITEFLQKTPFANAAEISQSIGRGFTSVAGTLTCMFRRGDVTREKDEEDIFRYALVDKQGENTQSTEDTTIDAEKDLGIEVGFKNDSHSRAVDVANGLNRSRALCDVVLGYIQAHPNTSAKEIASSLSLDFFTVGGVLLFLWSPHRTIGLERAVDEEGILRYTYTPFDPVEEAKKSLKEKTLDDFTPREMLEHLKKLGYKWKPGSMFFEEIKRTYVEFDKI